MAAGRIKGITIEIGGDTTKLTKALKNVDATSRSLQSDLRDINRLLKLDPGNVDLLKQKQNALAQSIENTKTKLQTLKTAQEQAKKQLESGDLGKSEYEALQREITDTEIKLKSLNAEYKQMNPTLQAVSAKFNSFGEGATKAGRAMMPVTIGIVGVGAAAVASFSKMEEGMRAVIKKTGATGEELEGMEQIVKDLATNVPADFETVGAAVGEVHTRFKLSGQALEDLSGKFVKFAQLNDTDVSTSVDKVSAVMNAFGMDASEADDLLDALNATGQATGIGMDTLASSLSANAAQLKAMGLTAQQASGFMGMVEMSGLDTSSAMRGLKTAMKKATAGGKTLNQALADFSNTMQGNESDTQKLQAAYDLFGSKAGGAIFNAVKDGKLNLSNFSSSLSDFQGNVNKTFEAMMTPMQRFQLIKNSLTEVFADIGNSILTVLTPALVSVSNILKRFSQMWTSIPASIQGVIVKIAIAAAAIAPMLLIIGKISTGISAVCTVMGKLSSGISIVSKLAGSFKSVMSVISVNPIFLIIGSIVALITALGLLSAKGSGIGEFFSTLGSKIQNVLSSLVAQLPNIINAIVNFIASSLPMIIQAGLQLLMGLVQAIPRVIPPIIGALLQLITSIVSFILSSLPTILDAGLQLLMGLVQAIPAVIQPLIDALLQLITSVVNFITSNIPIIINAGIQLLMGLIQAIPTVIQALVAILPQLITTITDFITSSLPMIIDAGVQLLSGLVQAIPTVLQALVAALPQLITSFINFMISSRIMIMQAGIQLLLGLVQALPTVIQSLVDALPDIIDSIVNTLIENIPTIIQGGIQLLMGLIKAIPTIVGALIKAAPQIVVALGEGIMSAAGSIFDIGINLIQGLWEGIKSVKDWIWDKISGFFSGIVDGIKNFFGIHSPSKLLADEIGKFLPPGLVIGFESAMPKAITSIQSSMGNMMDSMRQAVIPSSSIRYGSYAQEVPMQAQNNTQTYNQNVTINSPDPISPAETARLNRIQMRRLIAGVR